MERMHRSSAVLQNVFLVSVAFLLSATAEAGPVNSLSYTGVLNTPQSVFEQTFILTGADTVTFQTWGFGGGTNAAGQPIPPGGFDPLIALFTGSGPAAAMYVDGSGNPLADADNLLNAPWSFVGNCPPAGTVAIGADNNCGDDNMQVALPAGTYTLLLSDANYLPNALQDNGTLSEGFTDLTGGVFQTCDPATTCITPNGNYAVDIVSTGADITTAPEPSAISLMGIALASLAGFILSKRRTAPHTKGEAQ